MLDRTMSFMKHINNIISKASKVVKRNISNCPQSTKDLVFFNSSWNTLAQCGTPFKHSTLPALRTLKKSCLLGAKLYSNVTTMLQQLHWPTLDTRSKKTRLSLLYKAKNNLITPRIPSYYETQHSETRLYHQFFLYVSSYQNICICMNSKPSKNGAPHQQMSHPACNILKLHLIVNLIDFFSTCAIFPVIIIN